MSDVQMTHSTDCWKWHHECAKRAVEELAIDKERLRAENERLRQDAERYRWLRGHGSCPWAETDDEWVLPENMDAAVDAAMKANGLPESP